MPPLLGCLRPMSDVHDELTEVNSLKPVSYTHLDVYKRQRFQSS